jgi:DNA-binding transcriptional MerR regulator
MAESQEEKIKKIFKKYDLKVKDIQAILPKKGKGPYYNRVSKEPLEEDFVQLIKSSFGLDLVQELKNYDSENPITKIGKSIQTEEDRLKKKLEVLYDKLADSQQYNIDKLDKFMQEIIKLNDELKRYKAKYGDL